MLHPQVVIVQINVQIGEDQLVLDPFPDDAGHLVPVEVYDRVGDFDLCHGGQALRKRNRQVSLHITGVGRCAKLECV